MEIQKETKKINNSQKLRNLSQHPEINLCKDMIYDDVDVKCRKSKIICTLGPSVKDVESLVKLIDAGMNIARLNFSHGDHDYHRLLVKNLREALKQRPKASVAIMLDTKGPEIRTGKIENPNGVQLTKGQDLEFTTDYTFMGNEKKIGISYPEIVKLNIGQIILIGDGCLSGHVKEVKKDGIILKLDNDFLITNNKNVCLPRVNVELPTLSEKDENDLIEFGLKEGIDFIAASFVRKAEDIENIKDCLGPKGSHIKIISKIENHEGLDNYEEILDASDGIMIARGDLGMEIGVTKLFIAQKYMTDRANLKGKPIICATQMLESMIKNPRPTRAEASDVANAVLDGCDAVMLSGETAGGQFPFAAVEIMAKCCVEAESCINYPKVFHAISNNSKKPFCTVESICVAAVSAACDSEASLIVCITESGDLARLVAKFRPRQPILALCMSSCVIRQLNVSRGIISLKIPSFLGQDNLINNAIKYAQESGYIKKGDTVVCITGQNENSPDNVNSMKVMAV
jgi:pyruvate kinase